MPRKLTKLRIDEVSSVDKGAGEGARVVLMKRHDTPYLFNDIMLRKQQEENEVISDEDIIDPNDEPTVLHPKLQHMVNAMITAVPSLKEEHALFFLLHSPHGRALARHLSDVTKAKEQQPMNRTEELRSIAKAAGGMAAIVKNIIDRGSTTISEHEFSVALMEHAKANRKAGESVVKAFSRIIEEDSEIRRAYGIAKGYPDYMSLEPTSVEVGSTATSDDSRKAYEQAMSLAEAQHKTSPTLTIAQLFARILEQDPALAARAHRRPTTVA